MNDERKFYRVIHDTWNIKLPDHLENGFEDRQEFRRAVSKIIERWHDRIGEAIDERHGFLLLRFYDTPGGVLDQDWLPPYLLRPVEAPEYITSDEPSSSEELTEELYRAYGFD